MKLFPHYNGAVAEAYKCIKFKNGLHHQIKQDIGYKHILWFPELVKKCRIYDEDKRGWSTHYKSLSEERGRQLNHGKLYSSPADRGKQNVSEGKKPSG